VLFDLVGAQDDSMAMGARSAFEKIKIEEDRKRWLALPFTGCDGVPKTGQAWLRDGRLAATIIIPPLAGQAIEILARAVTTGKQPPEHTYTASTSLPALGELRPRKS
jgi:ribose transport system substrate-binding protein